MQTNTFREAAFRSASPDPVYDSSPSPVVVGGAIPHRKVIRSWLIPISSRNTGYALLLSAVDIALFLLTVAATVLATHPLLKLLLGALAGFIIGRLFILGHDACHQSFTANRKLNAWLGRVLMLPSLTPYSLWDVGHNLVHHGYTNLKSFDFVWHPKTLDEYRAMNRGQRLLERIYRSGWAPGLYYMVHIWWFRLYFPGSLYLPSRRAIFRKDCLLVTGFAALWIAALYWAALASNQSVALSLVAGFVVPFLFWNALIGFIVYVHHTHSDVVWYADKATWSNSQPFVSTTVHLSFRSWLGINAGTLLHHIMEHTAHHVDMSIPLYRLKGAQAVLESRLPGSIVRQHFSWRWYFDTARRCKLYDFDRRCWTDFSGIPTTEANGPNRSRP